jgi:hypothetical protein
MSAKMHLAAPGHFAGNYSDPCGTRPQGRGERSEPVNFTTCTNHHLSCMNTFCTHDSPVHSKSLVPPLPLYVSIVRSFPSYSTTHYMN